MYFSLTEGCMNSIDFFSGFDGMYNKLFYRLEVNINQNEFDFSVNVQRSKWGR